jgi:hypothetical protein
MMPMMNPYMMPPLGAGIPGMPGGTAGVPSTAPPNVAMLNMTAVMEIQNLGVCVVFPPKKMHDLG